MGERGSSLQLASADERVHVIRPRPRPRLRVLHFEPELHAPSGKGVVLLFQIDAGRRSLLVFCAKQTSTTRTQHIDGNLAACAIGCKYGTLNWSLALKEASKPGIYTSTG